VANLKVNLTKRIWDETAKDRDGNPSPGYRYCEVAEAGNGRVKPDFVIINDKPEKHAEGSYYLEWREKGERRRLSVGKNAGEAYALKLKKQAELNAAAHGIAVSPALSTVNGKRSLAVAVSDYLDEIKLSKKSKTHAAYSKALEYFQESCAKLHLEDIERKDLLKFSAFLRDDKKQAARSVANKFENVMSFLKAQGIRGTDLKISKHDWPRYTEEEPEIYEREDVDTLFASCTEEERLWFDFFLCTGEREQEVMHTYWSDVNLSHATVRVTHKPDRGWTPKAYREREIPIPQNLVDLLREWKRKRGDKACPLVFATKGCKVKLDFLDCLKRVAERATLNPDECWLHKFRATYATWSLRAGVDLRTVQDRMGHKDLESTMRYLRPDRSPEARNKVNEIFG
jgi:integrase